MDANLMFKFIGWVVQLIIMFPDLFDRKTTPYLRLYLGTKIVKFFYTICLPKVFYYFDFHTKDIKKLSQHVHGAILYK